jgi:hypothetical protein
MDRDLHDRYLDVIANQAGPLSDAMHQMGVAAGAAGRSLSEDDLKNARATFADVRAAASSFLNGLVGSQAPLYLRGADGQLQDALKLIIDGAHRGVVATGARDGAALIAAAKEMNDATRDIVAAASRITSWRSGAAAP